jgi:hypothetical protein
MSKLHLYIALFTALVFFGKISAQTSFTATVDKNPVGVNDRFKLTLTLENASGNVTPPDLSDFQLIFGPAKSTSYQFVNGQTSNTISYSYTLAPKATGDFTIEAAVANTDKGVLKSEPIQLKVIEGGSRQTPSNQPSAGTSRQVSGNDELIAEIRLDKKKAWKGEQVVVTYMIYSRYRNIDFTDYQFPSTNGFYSHDYDEEQAGWRQQLEVINGKQYRVAVLRKQMLFPQQQGKLRIEPMTVSARVDYSFFNPGRAITVKSNAAELEVLPLPAAPSDFKGDVGKFTFEVKPDRTELNANDAINLSVKISGNGNLKLVSAPKINFPPDFEVYDPKITDRFSTSGGGLSGSRTFEYLIIPRHQGEYTIEPLAYTYFDPASGNYVTLKSDPLQFNVGKGSSEPAGMVYSGSSKEDVLILGQDIRYIKPAGQLIPEEDAFFGSSRYYALLFLPLFGLLVIYLLRRKQINDRKNEVNVRSRQAGKIARKLLSEANQRLKKSETAAFYEAVFKALYGYLGGKLNIPPASLSREQIKSGLTEQGINETLTADLMNLLSRCEMARFAPSGELDPQKDYQSAARIIGELQKHL